MIIVTESQGDFGVAYCTKCEIQFDWDVHEETGMTDRFYPPLLLECPKCRKTNGEISQ